MNLLSKMIEKIIIKEDEVEVYFVFHIKDNTEFEYKKNDETIKISPSAITKMVGNVGLEPTTPRSQSACASQLRQFPKNF